jgi:hypothetical protein
MAAKLFRHQLHSIADTQNWQVTFDDSLFYVPGGSIIDAVWAAR